MRATRTYARAYVAWLPELRVGESLLQCVRRVTQLPEDQVGG